MHHFTAHQLHFTCEVQTPILLNEHQGSAIRGALFNALRSRFCFEKHLKDCGECALWNSCPICFLVASRNPESERGVEVPRPYTIKPPLTGKTHYEPKETLEFGLTMFAQALKLFPYIVLASQALERGGLGKRFNESARRDGRRFRGTFMIREIAAVNPLTGERQPVLRGGDKLVRMPDVPVTHHQVLQRAKQLLAQNPSQLTIHLLTPTRLIHQGHLVKSGHVSFSIFFHRLMERLASLSAQYSNTPLGPEWRSFLSQADQVETVEDRTQWVELESYSTRTQVRTPLGGLVGQVTFRAAHWQPFLPGLVWGQFTHLGKDTVKGNGWYSISQGTN